MLRLLSAGSNLSDDAKIYKRERVLELALAFCSSPVSDSESKVLVLKVILLVFNPFDFLGSSSCLDISNIYFHLICLICNVGAEEVCEAASSSS